MAKLLLFTQTYPYERGDVFLETEINYLARAFDEVLVLPWIGRGAPTRQLPANCRALPPMVADAAEIVRAGIFSRAPVWYFVRHLFAERAYASPLRLAKYLSVSVFCRAILSRPAFKRVNKEFREETIYFYWGIGTAYLMPFIQNARAKIVRFHGADLYAERHRGHYIPFRGAVYAGLTRAVYISRQGMEYAARRHPGANQVDARVSYLGTEDGGNPPTARVDGRIYLLSCSSVIPVKRVFLLLEALRLLEDAIVWTHLGGGKQWQRLAREARRLPGNLEVRLTGAITRDEVIDYYRAHPVDLFLNASASEGLPVSIMEAISFDIPVLATRVGGVAEIVTEEVGRLVEADITAEELAQKIRETIRDRKSFHPRQHWQKHFSAAENYPRFAREILPGKSLK
ncbi:MAG: glycosyltransferase [Odoribacteraceae bacterium]|jgi:glycosyltransferase involved in cell wall biosynthesis|nr:glycosyltransferase [Odoribacteraceae bacterium]